MSNKTVNYCIHCGNKTNPEGTCCTQYDGRVCEGVPPGFWSSQAKLVKDKQPTTAEATDEILKDEDQIGPRITPDDIEQAINSAQGMQFHQFPKTTVTVCCLTLGNGFCVIGKSAAVSEENFNVDIGMEVALDDVRNKLWELLGFRLKQALFEGALTDRP